MCFKIKFIYKIKRDLIFDYMEENDLDIMTFCNKCKITIGEFSDLMLNNPNIDIITLAKVINLTNIKLVDLLE